MFEYTLISFLLMALLFLRYISRGDAFEYPLMEMTAMILCLPGLLIVMAMLGLYFCGKLIWEVIKIAKV